MADKELLFNNVDVVKLPSKRKTIDQIPEVLHTKTLQNFFSATIDHLFQPSQIEDVAGYIGRKPSYYDPEKDFYVPENNGSDRETYQFEPMAISSDGTGNITNAMFFADLLRQLKFQGASTDNQNRLFEQDYYTWCPPVNLDMLINYSQYYWLEEGPEPVLVKQATDIDTDLVGKSHPDSDHPIFGDNGSVVVTSGMRIVVLDDANPDYNGKTLSIEGVGKKIFVKEFTDTDINTTPWDLFPWDMVEWDLTGFASADYIVMERGASDTNPWSKNNHWYHKDVLVNSSSSVFANLSNQARRPIICFERDLELYNYGWNRRTNVDILDDTTTSIDAFNNFRPPQDETWVLLSVDGELRFINENDGVSYEDQVQALKEEYSENPEKVFIVRNGTKILFTNVEYESGNKDRPFMVRIDNPVDLEVENPWDTRPTDVSYWESSNPNDLSEYSEVIGGYVRFIPIEDGQDGGSEPTEGDVIKVRFGLWQGREFWYNGDEWVQAQRKVDVNEEPLFTLYDAEPVENEGVRLDDDARYPDSSFVGNRIFGYQLNTDTRVQPDEFLNKRLSRNEWGELQYQNYMTVIEEGSETPSRYTYKVDEYETRDINGYYFWKIRGRDDFSTTDYYGNNWWKVSTPSRQYVIDRYVFPLEHTVKFRQSFTADGSGIDYTMFVAVDSQELTRVVVDGESVDFTISGNTISTMDVAPEGATVVIYLYNESKTNLEIPISQVPDEETDANIKNLIVYIDGKEATRGEHYTLINDVEFDDSTPSKVVAILKNTDANSMDIRKNANIEIHTYSRDNISIGEVPGTYEVPSNLSSNPDWEEVGIISSDQYLDQFSGIIQSQDRFEGNVFDSNNWRDSLQDKSLGRSIVQHTASMLRLMILNSNDDLDFLKASRYAEREYTRFRNKFLQKLDNKFIKGLVDENDVAGTVDTIIQELNLGKVFKQFAFSYSLMGGDNYFIPSTPSYLGLYPVYEPMVMTDTTYQNAIDVIQLHDGSVISAFGDIRDDVVLELEARIYDSIPEQFKKDDLEESNPILAFDTKRYFPGKFRQGITEYSRDEYVEISRPMFERWVAENQMDYRSHEGFDYTNLWTYNYSSVEDKDGEKLPGYWRGIYKWYFDTDRPHLTPWEMLGFSEKPVWWEEEYGPAPYTRGNLNLWEDLEAGYIRRGNRAGYDEYFKRPGLVSIIPVDSSGTLLDPWTAGIVARKPNYTSASRNWVYGDGGPIETVWTKTPQYPYAVSQISYLLKPVRWIEQCWNPLDDEYVYDNQDGGQLIRKDTRKRNQHSAFTVHGEEDATSTIGFVNNYGYQQWITDRLMSQGKNITTSFGEVIRTLKVNLGYKVGGFANQFNFFADNISGPLPDENINQYLYHSAPIKEESYSGVIVEWTGKGYAVYGYDVVNPWFKIIPGDPFGKKITHTVGSNYYERPPAWDSYTEYDAGDVVEFSNIFYRADEDHTSGANFNAEFWTNTTLMKKFDGITIEEQIEPAVGSPVNTIEYGHVFTTRQEVFNFLIAYQRYLENRGWVFEGIDTASGDVSDFRLLGKRFSSWAVEPNKEEGSFIKLSPFADAAKYSTEFGTIRSIEQVINGVYALLDQDGYIVEPHEISSSRGDSTIDISMNADKELFGVRLYVSEVEHIYIIDNTTIFDDLIYDPLYNQRQPRLKINGFRTRGWVGRLDAPGFIVTSQRIIPNFEKTANDFLRLYGIEDTVENDTLRAHAGHLIGYQDRPYLNQLTLSDTSSFQFYQGMLQAKGSLGSMNKLFRSQYITESRDIQIFEEWAFRLGMYGAVDIHPSLEFRLDSLNKKEIKEDPQMVKFEKVVKSDEHPDNPSDLDDRYDNIVTIYDYTDDDGVVIQPDERWLRRPTNFGDSWVTRDRGWNVNDLPNAGPVKTNEVEHYIHNEDELVRLATTLRIDHGKSMVDGERVWLYDTGAGDWTVLRITGGAHNTATVLSVEHNNTIDQDTDCSNLTEVVVVPNQRVDLSTSHGISSGDYFVIQPSETTELGQAEEILGTYKAEVGTHSSLLYYSTPTPISNTWEGAEGPEIYTYMPVRYKTLDDVTTPPLTGWQSREVVYEFVYNDLAQTSGEIKLIDESNLHESFIREVKLELITPFVGSDMGMTIGNDNNDSLVETYETSHFIQDDFPTEVIVNSERNIQYNSQLVGMGGVQHKISSDVTGYVGDIRIQILDGEEFYDLPNGEYSFSVGTLDNPELFIANGEVELTEVTDITKEINYSIIEPSDIYVFFDFPSNVSFNGLPLKKIRLDIGFERVYIKEDDVYYPSNLPAKLYYDFTNATSTAGSFKLVVTATHPTHDIIYIDDARTPTEINSNENAYWGVYVPNDMRVFTSDISVGDFQTPEKYSVTTGPVEFHTPRTLFIDEQNQEMDGLNVVMIEVEVTEEFSNTENSFSGGFDHTFITNGTANTAEGVIDFNDGTQMWKAVPLDISLEHSGYTDNIVDGIVKTLSISIADGGEFVRPTFNSFDSSVDYTTGDMICSNGVVYEANTDISAGASFNSSEWDEKPKLQMTIGTMSNPTKLIASDVVDMAVAGLYSFDTEIKMKDAEELYVFFNFNDYNINDDEASAINIEGTIHSFAEIFINGTDQETRGWAYGDGITLVDELNRTGTYRYAVPFDYVESDDISIALVHYSSTTGGITVRLQTWDEEWKQIRQETRKIDSNQIESAMIYDIESERVVTYLTYYDPYKGVIPGDAEREIYWKMPTDPAKYTHGTTVTKNIDPDAAWGPSEVGRLWWDLSTTRVLEYEIENDEQYSWKNWGKFAPETEVDVYEWVRSPVPPSQLDSETLNVASYSGQLDGEIRNPDNPSWVQRVEWDRTIQDYRNYYYFWMKNKKTVPNKPFRTISAYQVSRLIQSPSSEGLPWFAPMGNNGILLGSLRGMISNENLVVQVNWKVGNNDGNIHQQWILLRENDQTEAIDRILWNKMRDSLVGWDNHTIETVDEYGNLLTVAKPQIVPDNTLSVVEKYGTFYRPRQTWFKTEADGAPSREARKIMVQRFNTFLAERETPFVDNYADFIDEIQVSSDMPLERTKTLVGQIYDYQLGAETTILKDEVVGFVSKVSIEVRDLFVDGVSTISVGTDEDPELFVKASDVNLRTTGTFDFTDKVALNEPTTIKVFMDFTGTITGELSVSLTTVEENLDGYDYSVSPSNDGVTGREARDLLEFNPGLVAGDRVLVTDDNDIDGFWSLWEYDEDNNFNIVDVQQYRIDIEREDFIQYADWYLENSSYAISSESTPLFYYDTYTDMQANAHIWVDASLVAVNDDGGRWSWYIRDSETTDGWILAGREKGSIELTNQFYESEIVYAPAYNDISEWVIDFATVTGRDGSREINQFLDVLRNQTDDFLRLFQNQIFFALVKYVHAEQSMVDWVYKTSFVYITGFNEALTQKPVQTTDSTESLLDYINEVKPYHTKIREFVRSLSADMDIANFLVQDFDKPQTWNAPIPGAGSDNYVVANANDSTAEGNDFGPFDESTEEGRGKLLERRPWTEWWSVYAGYHNATTDEEKAEALDNYLKYVRNNKTTLLFDRVDTKFDDFINNDTLTDEQIAALTDSGAVARMMEIYPDLKENWTYYKSLIPGATFRGTVVDGGDTVHNDIVDFENNAWDLHSWGKNGWDETAYKNVYPLTGIWKTSWDYTNNGVQDLGDFVNIDGVDYYRKPVFEDKELLVMKVAIIVNDSFESTATDKVVHIGTSSNPKLLVDGQDLTFPGEYVYDFFEQFDVPTTLYTYLEVGALTSGIGGVIVQTADKVEKVTYKTRLNAVDLQAGIETLAKTFSGLVTEVRFNVVEEFDENEIDNISLTIGDPYDNDAIHQDGLVQYDIFKLPETLPSGDIVLPGEQVFSVNKKIAAPVNMNVYFDFTGVTVGAIDVEFKVEYVQQVLNEAGPLAPYYDTGVDGGQMHMLVNPGGTIPAYDWQTDDTPQILTEGGKLLQPFVAEDHPEELAPMIPQGVAAITVHTESTIGAPSISMQRFQGNGSSGPFKIFNISQTTEAVIIHRDRQLLTENDDYIIDWNAMTVTFLDKTNSWGFLDDASTEIDYGSINDSVDDEQDYGGLLEATDGSEMYNTRLDEDYLVTLFSAGGARILEQKTYRGIDTYKFTDEIVLNSVWADNGIDKSAVMVTVNGEVPTSFDIDIVEHRVISIVPAPDANDVVQIVLFDSPVYSVVYNQQEYVTTEGPYTYPYAITMDHPSGNTKPEHTTTLVYRNGWRLVPPDTEYFEGDGVTTIFPIPAPYDLDNVQVMVDDVIVSNYTLHPNRPLGTEIVTEVTMSGDDYISQGYIDIDLSTFVGSEWDGWTQVPHDALWITLNGVLVRNWVIEGNPHRKQIRLLRASEQPQSGDTIVVRIYSDFVHRLRVYDEGGIYKNFDNGEYHEFEQATKNDDQIYVTVDGIAVDNWYILSPDETNPDIHHLYFTDEFGWDFPAFDGTPWDTDLNFVAGQSVPNDLQEVRIMVVDEHLNNEEIEVEFDGAPIDESIVEVVIYENYDYIVNGDDVEIQERVMLEFEDEIEIITFTEDSSLGIRTEVFEGVQNSTYVLSQMPTNAASVWATVDRFDRHNPDEPTEGMDQYQTRDFAIEYKEIDGEERAVIKFGTTHARPYDQTNPWGADTDQSPVPETGIQEYTWDMNVWEDDEYLWDSESSLPFGGVHPQPADLIHEPGWDIEPWDGGIEYERDRVWITSFSGEPVAPAVAFRLFKTYTGAWEHIRISDLYKTYLNKPLSLGSSSIELIPNPDIPSAMIPSDILAGPTPQSPGVIWIGGERIEYRNVSNETDSNGRPVYTLSGLTRGTLGTSSGIKSPYNRHGINGDGVNTVFPLPDSIIDNFDDVAFMSYSYAVDRVIDGETFYKIASKRKLGTNEYEVFREDGVWKVRFNEAPEESVLASSEPFFPTYNPDAIAWDLNDEWDDEYDWDQGGFVPDPQPLPEAEVIEEYYPTIMAVGYEGIGKTMARTVQYDVGVEVIDGTHFIPGGYKWEANPSGIQRSDASYAKYLIAKPGTYI